MSGLFDEWKPVESPGDAFAPTNAQPGDASTAPDVAYGGMLFDLYKKKDYEGILRATRKMQFPQLFNEKMPRALVEEWARANPLDPAVYGWIKDMLRGGHQKGRWIVFFHPAFKRECIAEWVNNPENPGYYLTFMAMDYPKKGYLPPDLDKIEFRHHRGTIGDRRHIIRQDVEVIARDADRSLSREEQDRRLNALDELRKKEADCKKEAFAHDFHDYNFLALNTAANGGVKQYSLPTVEVRMNPAKYMLRRTESGVLIRAKRGSKFERMYEAEERQEAKLREAAEVLGVDRVGEMLAAGNQSTEHGRTRTPEQIAQRESDKQEAMSWIAYERSHVAGKEQDDPAERQRLRRAALASQAIKRTA